MPDCTFASVAFLALIISLPLVSAGIDELKRRRHGRV
jgi:hypothetical protein